MSKNIGRIKSFRRPPVDQRPLSNKFVTTIQAGLASAGPPLGPLLGKYGVNIVNFCKEFNKKTSDYIEGLPIPCVVTINPDRSFALAFRKPSFEHYLKQAAGVANFVKYNGISGKVTIKHIYEIAKIKHEDPHDYIQLEELKDVVKKYLREAHEKGIEVVREIDPVEYGEYLKQKDEYIAKIEAEIAAAKEAKLLRA